MPIYYNAGAPVGGSKNSITITAKDLGLRDFLLSKNIQNPIRYPRLSTSINGSPKGGEPFLDTMVGIGAVLPQVSIEKDGLFRYSIAILPNHYKDMDPAAPLLLGIDKISATHPTGYPISPSGTLDYSQEDHAKFGVGGISEYYEFRKKSTLKNLYLDATKQIDIADLISLQPIQTDKQLPSYDQAFGQIAGSQGATEAVNVIGSILNGQGVGIGNGGLSTNFDIRSSLAGRVLGATGLLNDTKLGIVGGQQLALALANNAAFNVQEGLLGALNVQDNLLSLVKGEKLPGFRPQYKITVSSTLGGQLIGLGEKILGFQVPKSRLQDEGSIFSDENKYVENIERANSMLKNTGKGQRDALKDNINANGENILGRFRSGYVPGFEGVKNIQGYAFMNPQGHLTQNFLLPTDGIIPDLSYLRERLVNDSGFEAPANTNIDFEFLGESLPTNSSSVADVYGNGVKHINNPTFSWVASETTSTSKPINTTPFHVGGSGSKKSLLGKTQILFNSVGMKNLVSVKGDMTIGEGSQLQTSVVNGGISKGSAVLRGDLFDINGNIIKKEDDADKTFCRSWTTFDRYDKIYKLIRNRGLNKSQNSDSPIIPESNKWRLKTEGSVLDDNGFVKIAPYKTDNLTRSASNPKKYMFSIENLAWAGSPAVNLLPIEQGPGDLITGKFGRIMWFPPYDLTFSETNSVSLETTNFIGRGEPIYTYNNTERTGSLSFKIIIDHPSIMNAFKGNDGPPDEFIRSWYAGCVDLDSKWANKLTIEDERKRETKTTTSVKQIAIPKKTPPNQVVFYFPNDVTDIGTILTGASATTNPPNGCGGGYENGDGKGIGDYNGEAYKLSAKATTLTESPDYVPISRRPPKGDGLKLWPDTTDYGKNGPNTFELKINGKDYTNPNGWNDPVYIADLRAYLNPANPQDGCPECVAECKGVASSQGTGYANEQLAMKRRASMRKWLIDNDILPDTRIEDGKSIIGSGNYNDETSTDQEAVKTDRRGTISFENRAAIKYQEQVTTTVEPVKVSLNQQVKRRFYNEADFFEKLKQSDPLVFDSLKQKIRYFDPAFHSMTPEGFNSRLTFLLQCTRQGPTISEAGPANLAFGPPPVCILRIGDFYNTKIMMDNVNIDYEPLVWDLNPEGVGVQPMIANVTISFKYIGGSSLYSPINKLQNALSFNYFANTQVYDPRADYVAKNGSNERTTNKEENKDAAKEIEYKLFPGLDSTTTSMGASGAEEVSTITTVTLTNPDGTQVQQSNTATNTANTPAGLPDISRIKLSGVTPSVINWSADCTASFTIYRADPNDKTSLNANYDIDVTIHPIGETQFIDEFHTIKLPQKLDGAALGNQNFSFKLSDMVPPYLTGLTSASTYSFNVKVGDIGSSNATIETIGNTTTESTVTTTASATNFTDEEVIDCIAFGNPAASSIDEKTSGFTINFKFEPHETQSYPRQTIQELILNKKVEGKIYLDVSTPTSTKTYLDSIYLAIDNKGTYFITDSTNTKSYFNGKPTNPWSAEIVLEIFTSEQFAGIKDALTKPDTSINVKWSNQTGSGLHANWNSNATSATPPRNDVTTDTANINKELGVTETDIINPSGNIAFKISKKDKTKNYSQEYLVKAEITNLAGTEKYAIVFDKNIISIDSGTNSFNFDFNKMTPPPPGLKITKDNIYSLGVTLVGQTFNENTIFLSHGISTLDMISNATVTQNPPPATVKTTTSNTFNIINGEVKMNGSVVTPINDCDSAHTFTELEGKIKQAQDALYRIGVNPKITQLNVSITSDRKNYTQTYDFTVGDGFDGKAWMGFTTIGSCGDDYISRADDQYLGRGEPGQSPIIKKTGLPNPCYKKSLEKCMIDNVNAGEVELIGQPYQNDALRFKQYFVQFTKTTFPPK